MSLSARTVQTGVPSHDQTMNWIEASKKRSLDLYRLDPGRAQPRILGETLLRQCVQAAEPILQIARVGMGTLFEQVRDAGYMVILTDAAGVAVECLANPLVDAHAKRLGLRVGSCWTEDWEGTCAVGLSLLQKSTLTVHHGDHFAHASRHLTCSSSPILNSEGDVLGVLDVTALESPEDRRSQHLALALVNNTARMIEAAHFVREYSRYTVLRLSTREQFLDVNTEGLLAINSGGTIVAVNLRFEHDFGCSRSTVVGVNVQDLFGMAFGQLLQCFDRQAAQPLRLRILTTGSTAYGLIRRPASTSRFFARALVPSLPQVEDSDITQDAQWVDIVGNDAGVKKSARQAVRSLDKGIAILLQGESGTGKERFAQALHACSRRPAGEFVAVNCAAIPESLIESELFGYAPGAFTGARARGAKGKFLQAHGGTLFLDEIGDMPAELQTRLLRVLSDKEVWPLGASQPVRSDFQLICATHRNLMDEVQAQRFRLDLYYRINGLTITLPSLRERSDFDTVLARIFEQEAADLGATSVTLSDAAKLRLASFSWPGNIRQLRQVLRTALVIMDGTVLEESDLPPELRNPVNSVPQTPQRNGLDHALEQTTHMLAQCDGNISEVARALGVNRSTIYRRLNKGAT